MQRDSVGFGVGGGASLFVRMIQIRYVVNINFEMYRQM